MNRQDLALWNARQRRARDAYRADRMAADGICVTCEEHPRVGFSRQCVKCQMRKVRKR